jgi:hypothetical protein
LVPQKSKIDAHGSSQVRDRSMGSDTAVSESEGFASHAPDCAAPCSIFI